MHCNLRPPDLAPVVLRFERKIHNSLLYQISAKSDNPWPFWITRWQNSARVFWGRQRKGKIGPPLPQTPEPMVTKIGMGDEVGDPYPCAEFRYNTVRGFCVSARAYKVTRLVIFGAFLFSTSKPLHWFLRSVLSNDVVSRKDVPFERGPREQNFTFRPHFPKTGNLRQILTRLKKIRAEKALRWKTSRVNTPNATTLEVGYVK